MTFIVIILLLLLSCSSPKTEEKVCLPKFESQNHWVVADGGRSVKLPNNTLVHFFGDSLIKNLNGQLSFVGNSIGLAKCYDGKHYIQYFWREHGFFETNEPGVRLWPVDAEYINNKLYINLSKIINKDNWFDYVGTIIAVVNNPLDLPLDWDIEYIQLTDRQLYWPIHGLKYYEGYLYIFSALHITYDEAIILLRAPIDNLTQLEFLSRSNQFKSIDEFDSISVKRILSPAPFTFYVHYHEDIHKWVTIHDSSTILSDEVVIQTADTFTGDWSDEKVIYTFPEMQEYNVACYAVTEQPGLSTRETIVFTYACNTLDALPDLNNLDLYRPKAVTLARLTVVSNLFVFSF